jgi:hypothetical protein
VSQVELCLEEVVNTLVSGEQDNDPTKSSRMHAAHSAASMRYLEVVSELQLCLITLVQGPCYANRNALGEGGVFVTLNKLFSLNVIIEATSQQPNSAADSPKSKKRSSKSASTDDYVQLGDVEDDEDDGSDQMPAGAQTLLLDLRNNAIRLLLSLLEGRDNEFVIRQMTETVEPHWIMTELYDLSQVYYQQRLYADRDPEVERQRQKELAEHLSDVCKLVLELTKKANPESFHMRALDILAFKSSSVAGFIKAARKVAGLTVQAAATNEITIYEFLRLEIGELKSKLSSKATLENVIHMRIGSIEVRIDDSSLETIYFPKREDFELTPSDKRKLLENLTLGSDKDRLDDFLHLSEQVLTATCCEQH